MTKLVKNELIKVFHKKSIYIMLIIMFVISALGTVITLVFNNGALDSLMNITDDYEVKNLETVINEYDLSKEDEKASYIITKVEYLSAKDRMTFKESYKKEYVNEYAYDYIYCEVENEVNGKIEEAEKCRKEHAEIINEIENNDWRFFVEKDIKEIEEQINNPVVPLSKDAIEELNINKKALEYQLKYNISPLDSKISIINGYKSSKINLIYYENKKKALNDEEKTYYKSLKAESKIAEYKLENDLLYTEYGPLMSLDSTFKGAGFFVIITMALIAGSIVSDEFNKGTIKQLLIRPYSRNKILLSKLITVFIVFVVVLLSHYLFNIVSNIITGDANEILMPILKYNVGTDTVYRQSIFLSLIFCTLEILPCYLIIMIFAFLISTVTKNDALGILAGIGLYFGGNMINLFLSLKDLWINKFIPTLCWDLSSYLSNYEPISSIILPLVVDIVTIIIMLVIAFIVFKKTDIKNQ